MSTGQRIKAARKKAGLTQKELGAKLGVAYQTLAQWENDLRNPKYGTLKKIADALGVEWTELVPEEEQAQSVINHIKEGLKGAAKYNIDDNAAQLVADKLDVSILELYPENQQEAVKKGWLYGWEDKEEELTKTFGYSFSDEELTLIENFGKLNTAGRAKAVERIEELTEIPKYTVR